MLPPHAQELMPTCLLHRVADKTINLLYFEEKVEISQYLKVQFLSQDDSYYNEFLLTEQDLAS